MVAAAPSDSQNLRGLGDRVFEVHVTGWAYDETTFQPIQYEFDNCYVFQSDGTFIDPAFPDPAFPIPGTWSQQSVGAATPYAAEIEFDVGGGFVLSLDQTGHVRPGRGGVLMLEADTVLTLTVNGNPLPGFGPWGEFVSSGVENPDCFG